MSPLIPAREDVVAAQRRSARYVRVTPTLTVDMPRIGSPVVLKLEQLQHTGSFKVRGVFNALLSRHIPPAGVVTASGGNHGAALAFAAARLGHLCTVFVPSIAPRSKIRLIERYGAVIRTSGSGFAEAAEAAIEHAAATGAVNVHAYNDPDVIAGQGTLAAELQEQVPHLDAVVASIGGGGFLGGIAAWFGDTAHLTGVEPERSPSMYRARTAGRPVDSITGGLAADSLGCRRVGDLAFTLAERHVEDLVLVTDEQTRAAQRWLWQECRVIAEPGGATALAALLTGRVRSRPGQLVAVIICGGNTTLDPTLEDGRTHEL